MNSTTSAPGSTQQSSPPPATSFFAAIRSAGFVRPDERIAAGVSGALANRWRIDPILVRVGFVVLCLFGGLGLMVYAVGWLLLPDTKGVIHLEESLAGRFSPGAVGALVVLIISIFSIGPVATFGDGPSFGGLIALAALVLVIIVVLHGFGVIGGDHRAHGVAPAGGPVDLNKHHGGHGTAMQHVGYGPSAAPHAGVPHVGYGPSAPPPGTPFQGSVPQPPAPPKPRKQRAPRRGYPGGAVTTLTAGLALLVAGAIVVMRDELPAGADLSAVVWAAVLGLLALALVVVGLSGRRSGWIGALAAAAFVFAVSHSVSGGVDGDRFFADDVSWTPTSLDAEVTEYQLDAGTAVLDLTDLDPTDLDSGSGTDSLVRFVPEVSADVSVGELRVIVPDDLTVQMDTGVGIGDLVGGSEGTSRIGAAGSPDLRLNLNVGIGSMIIEEVSR